jgi:FkbM family methyltransferase
LISERTNSLSELLMAIQEIITRVSRWFPESLKIVLRGKRESPNRLANLIHSLLNRIPADRYPVLRCAGVLEGYRMRVDWQIHRSFVYGSWEPEVVEMIKQQVTAGMRVLDLGAQSGFYSLLFSKLVGPSGSVVAFEPLPANYRLLEENLNLNRITNVTVERSAVADRSGEISFDFPVDEPSLVAGPVLESDNQGTFRVPSISIDDFIVQRRTPVHFIKMDVEGAEGMVLRGAKRTLEEFHPILAIELHFTGQVSPSLSIPLRLRELGYQIRWLTEGSRNSHILATWGTKT